MEDRRDEQFDDLLDRAAEALARTPVPPGPPPEAATRLLEAIRNSPSSSPLSLWEKAGLSALNGPLSLWERVRVRAFGAGELSSPANTKRIKTMKRLVKIAVAASVLVAITIAVSWILMGGTSTNLAFARVADALDSLRSATYDVTSESKGEPGQPSATATGKGFFLAPSHQRIELSTKVDASTGAGHGPAPTVRRRRRRSRRSGTCLR